MPTARAVTGGGLATGGGALTEDREISVPVATQAEAEAGEDNTTAMTPLRVAQAIAELAPGSSGYTNWGDIDGAISSQMDLMGALGEKVNAADLGGAAWAEVWDFDAVGTAAAVAEGLSIHGSNTSNPHSVTKEQVGLGNADNTSDADKPVSDATQTALDGKLSLTGGTVVGDIYVSDSFTVDGRDLSVDGTKLDGIESGANVTDAANVEAAGAVMESDTTAAAMSFVVDEDDMVSDSAFKLPTQQSVKAYVDSGLSGKQASGSYVTALTGDVTASGPGSVAATITNDAVTNAKAADMAESTLKGRAAGAGTGDPTDLTATQATAILNEMVGDAGSGVTKGLVPAASTGNASTHFLRKDGTWAAPGGSGTGDVVGPATNTDNHVPLWDGADSKTLKNGYATSQGGNGAADSGKIIRYNASGNVVATSSFISGATEYTDDGPLHTQGGNTLLLGFPTLTGTRVVMLPDATGTIALLEQLRKPWVNFDGDTAANLTGTYSRTGTTVTVTATNHGHIVGHYVYLDFTSGAAVDGSFVVVSVANANTFTVTHGTSGSTSGNVTLLRRSMRKGYGIQSVAYANAVGAYYVNVVSGMFADADYAVSVSASDVTDGQRYATPHSLLRTVLPSAVCFTVEVRNSNLSATTNCDRVQVITQDNP